MNARFESLIRKLTFNLDSSRLQSRNLCRSKIKSRKKLFYFLLLFLLRPSTFYPGTYLVPRPIIFYDHKRDGNIMHAIRCNCFRLFLLKKKKKNTTTTVAVFLKVKCHGRHLFDKVVRVLGAKKNPT